MEVYNTLLADIKAAMVAKDKKTSTTLRMIKAAVVDKAKTDKVDISDELFLKILTKQINDKKELLVTYASRPDMVEETQLEIDISNKYMPKPYTSEETDELITSTIESIKGDSPLEKKHRGAIMKELGKYKALVDYKVVVSTINDMFKGI